MLSVDAPCCDADFLHVHVGGLDDAQRIESGVLEEALVLGREHRLDQHLGQIGELHQPALLAVPVEQVGQQLGLEHVLRPLGVVARGDDARHRAAGEVDHAAFLVEIRFGAGEDLHGFAADVVPAHGIAAGFRVAASPELIHDLVARHAVAQRDGLRRGEDHGRALEGTGAQLGVDQPGELGVVVGERQQPAHHEQCCDRQRDLARGLDHEMSQSLLARYVQFQCHKRRLNQYSLKTGPRARR